MAGRVDLMHTLNYSHEYKFSWTIDNFKETLKVFQGPLFCPIPRSPDEKYCFEMEFDRATKSSLIDGSRYFPTCLYVYLKKLSGSIAEFNVKGCLSFRTIEDKKLHAFVPGSTYIEVGGKCLLGQLDFLGFNKGELRYICLLSLKTYFALPENKLVMKGKLTFCGGFMNSIINSSSLVQQSSEDHQKLSKDLKTMYRSGLESDITIHIGDKTLFTNKCILCCRSPVFKKMFDTSMKERRSNTIHIKDIEFHVFDCFIMYLYTGELEDKTWDTVMSLYSVADKYEVEMLQRSCSRILESELSVETACSVLFISVLHNDEELKTAAINFICWHFREVALSSEWADIVSTKPQLASEVLSRLTALKP